MKEIGKLIELLNEYERKVRKKSVFYPVWFYDENIGFHHGNTEYNLNDEYVALITSKKYGFIKWLVENKKIDKSKVFSFIDTADKPYEDILCLLALSDEPINDLISVFKENEKEKIGPS